MKNILITGASGMLGSAVCDYFARFRSYAVCAAGRSLNSYVRSNSFAVGDLNDAEYLDELSNIQFDAIVHCAALTDIERCEKEPESAFLINTKATQTLAEKFPQTLFIYISTDSVFDGKTGNYSESSQTEPLNVYAQSKLEGEKKVFEANEKHYILRTNMYGFHRPPSGRSLFEWSNENLSSGNQVNGFSNVVFNPLYVGQIAEIIEKMISRQPAFGIYNAVCNEHISKLEFLQKIARKFGYDESLIIPTKISERPVNAVRPLKTFLKNEKLSDVFNDVDLSIEKGFAMLYDEFSNFKK